MAWEPTNYTPHYTLTSMASNLVSQVKTMLVVGRRLTKAGSRYFIYLPVEYNEVWGHWYENGAVLRMVIEVVEFKKANSEKPTQPNTNP
jgi:hypothetical protein